MPFDGALADIQFDGDLLIAETVLPAEPENSLLLGGHPGDAIIDHLFEFPGLQLQVGDAQFIGDGGRVGSDLFLYPFPDIGDQMLGDAVGAIEEGFLVLRVDLRPPASG